MSQEKRHHDRKDLSLPVRVELGSEVLDCTASNLSVGGARVVLSRALPFGTRLKVRVRLPALAEESVIDAQVRWCGKLDEGFSVGLQFLRVRARETWGLNEFVRG